MRQQLKRIFPDNLWTGRYIFWWVTSLLTLLCFDLLWMGQTTFRPMSTLPFWPYLLLGATLLAFPSLFDRRGILMLIALLGADLVMTANLMYCRTYFNAIPAGSYLLAGNLKDFGPSVADSFRWYFAFLPLIPIGAFVWWQFLLSTKKESHLTQRPRFIPYLITLAVLAVFAWGADCWRGGPLANMRVMRDNAYAASGIAAVYTIPGFIIHDMLESSEQLSPEDEAEVEQWLLTHQKITQTNLDQGINPEIKTYSQFRQEILADSIRQGSRFGRKNLILVLCESLESWPLEKSVEGIELTPFLNSLIADSTTFYAPHVVSQVGNGRSIDGQLLILAGMLPMRHRVYAYDAADNLFFTLPKAVKGDDGRAYILTCDKPYVWNEARVAPAFGVDTLLDASDFIINETAGPSRRLSDGSLMAQSVEKMKRGEIWKEGERAFMMLVTYSGHNPFKLPEKLRRIELKDDYPEIVRDYMLTVNYTDHSLQTLVDYLRSRPDWEETLVVITGDHEGLASDRKTAVNNPLSTKFVDPGQHTPLIILNSPVAGRYEGEMGEVDIYPTILDLMGKSDYVWRGMGWSVLDPKFPGVAIGSSDDVYGDSASTDSATLNHLRRARDISDRILRFDLLRRE